MKFAIVQKKQNWLPSVTVIGELRLRKIRVTPKMVFTEHPDKSGYGYIHRFHKSEIFWREFETREEAETALAGLKKLYMPEVAQARIDFHQKELQEARVKLNDIYQQMGNALFDLEVGDD